MKEFFTAAFERRNGDPHVAFVPAPKVTVARMCRPLATETREAL